MWRVLLERWRQKHRTMRYPDAPPALPERFRGRPVLDAAKCRAECDACVRACSVDAIWKQDRTPTLDLGRCLFCGDCAAACPAGAIQFTNEHRLAAAKRDDLLVRPDGAKVATALHETAHRLFGRSLKLRQVSAGGCNACEADSNVLTTLAFDLGRFGITFVAAPRHADGLLVTGPVSQNMKLALEKTYAAVPSPKIVIATGACAISGGPYAGREEVCGGADAVVPVDLYIPGCPPHPITILDGLLRFLGRIENEKS